MEENNKSITLIAKVNITYKGESRIAAVRSEEHTSELQSQR